MCSVVSKIMSDEDAMVSGEWSGLPDYVDFCSDDVGCIDSIWVSDLHIWVLECLSSSCLDVDAAVMI